MAMLIKESVILQSKINNEAFIANQEKTKI